MTIAMLLRNTVNSCLRASSVSLPPAPPATTESSAIATAGV